MAHLTVFKLFVIRGVQARGPFRGTRQNRTQDEALERRHSDVAEADASDRGQNLCGQSGVLELIQQNQQIHQLFWGLRLAELYR